MSKSSTSLAQTNNFTQLDWYLPLVENIHDTIKMAVIESRIRLVEGYWNAGKLIRTASDKGNVTDLLHALAVDTGISERELWYALKAYDTYPEFGKIPDGNNVSWHKLKTQYLTTPTDKPEEHLITCPNCGFKSNREDFK